MENNLSVNAAAGQSFKANEKKQDPQLDQLILAGPGVIPRQDTTVPEKDSRENSAKPKGVSEVSNATDQVSLGKEVSRRITAPGGAQGTETREGSAAGTEATEARSTFTPPAVTAFVQNAEGATESINTTDTFTRGGANPADQTFRPTQAGQTNGLRQNARKANAAQLPAGTLTAPVDGRGLAVGLQEFLSNAVEQPDFAQTAAALGVKDTNAFAETVKSGNALATFNQIDASKISLINAQGDQIEPDQIAANVGVKLVVPPVEAPEPAEPSALPPVAAAPPAAPQKSEQPVEAPEAPLPPQAAVAPPEVRQAAQDLGVADAGALANALESGNTDQVEALIDPTSLNVAERLSDKLNARSVQGPVTPTVEAPKAFDENKVRGTDLAAKKQEENLDPLLAQIRNPVAEQIKKAQIAPSPAEAQPQPQDAQPVTA